MPKKGLKKKLPLRGKAFKQIRLLPNGGLEQITLRNGTQMIINPMKHFLLQKEYINEELQTNLIRMVGRYAIGEEEYSKLEQQANEVRKTESQKTGISAESSFVAN